MHQRVFVSPALAQNDLLTKAQQQFKPIPTAPPQLPGNPATPAKVLLGTMLFFEPRLSASHAISCNSCHNLGLGGADADPTSIGHRWQHGGRNAPTVLNAVFNTAQFWDGRAKDLEQQAGGPILNPIEMGSPAPHVAEQLKGIPGYRDYFAKAFSGEGGPITLGQCPEGDRGLRGDLDHAELAVRSLPRGQGGPAFADATDGAGGLWTRAVQDCHNGVNVGAGMYAPFGVVEKPGAELLPPNGKGGSW